MKRRFSATKLKLFSSCALAAKFRYVDLVSQPTNSYMEFGSAVHEAIEAHNRGTDVVGCLNVFVERWNTANDRIDWWPEGTDWDNMRARGMQMIRSYDERMADVRREVVAVEHEFIVPIGPYELHGYVDSIELRHDDNGFVRLCLIDYKTGAVPTLHELAYDLQFTIYDWASQDPSFWESIPGGRDLVLRFGGRQRKLIWSALGAEREIAAIPRTAADYEAMYRLLCQIDQCMEADLYLPSISASTCGRCDYQDLCGRALPIPSDLGALAT